MGEPTQNNQPKTPAAPSGPTVNNPQAPTNASAVPDALPEVADMGVAAAPLRGGRVDNRDLLAMTRSAISVGRDIPPSDLMDDSIIARPLVVGTGFFDLKPKNPDVVFRGVNRAVNTSDGPSFIRYETARAEGYVNATPEDCMGTVPSTYVREGNKIMYGDLILMKIGKAKYRGALKWKDQQALRATKRAGTVESGNAELAKAALERNIPPQLARKLQPFSPSSRDIDTLREAGEE